VWWSRKIKGGVDVQSSAIMPTRLFISRKVPISVRWAESIGCNGVDTVDCGLTRTVAGRGRQGDLELQLESIPAFGVLLRPVQITRWQMEWTMANIIAGSWVAEGDLGGWMCVVEVLVLVHARPKLSQTLPGLGALSDSFLASPVAHPCPSKIASQSVPPQISRQP
jgi:hypothetical protein